jgi:diaminopimelate decarboxylase
VNELTRWFEGRGFALEHINVGGGLGINYDDPDVAPVPDFEGYFAAFARTLDVGNKQIHFELGRSIVGQCGELISRVLYRKTTPTGREVAIVDASMTELMRPALYGAHHCIENLTSPDAPMMNYMVAGTVCESSDIFARDVELPELHRGDMVAIQSAGAYGRSMASCYNLHALPDAVYSDEI